MIDSTPERTATGLLLVLALTTGEQAAAGASLGTSPAWWVDGNEPFAVLGTSVATAGDVNGDGYADVIVGVPFIPLPNYPLDVGKAWIYHGSPLGLGTVPVRRLGNDPIGTFFGESVATAGDVNGDGYADVIVGARRFGGGSGRAFVYHGSAAGLPDTPAWTADGGPASSFGRSVATAGDVNGDGYADVIVGAPFAEAGEEHEGQAFLWLGSATGLEPNPAWTAEGDQVDAEFGVAVATAGDVNGDGYADVIVGARRYDKPESGEGRAFVYLGSDAGLAPTPAWTAEGDQVEAYFGWSVASAGDIDGDGYADVVVGAPFWGTANEGQVFVYRGSASGLGSDPVRIVPGGQASAYFGWSVASAGDVNGDGHADLIVAAVGYDNGEFGEGRVTVYHGPTLGLWTGAAWSGEGDQTNAEFGWSVATAGDVDGDGYSDVIVGADWYDCGQTNEGRALLYRGNAGPAEPDDDEDGWVDSVDNCPYAANASQEDGDDDGPGDPCDNCPFYNPLQENVDGDGFGDPCDNCWYAPNLTSTVAGFETIRAPDPFGFCWDHPAEIRWVRGELHQVSSYTIHVSVASTFVTCLFDGSSVPEPGAGYYYLVRALCEGASWQTSLGAEPGRDVVLP